MLFRSIDRHPVFRRGLIAALALLLVACGGGGGGDDGGKPPRKPSLTAIAITPATATVAKGQNTVFTATGSYSDGTSADITGKVTWSESDSSIATIEGATGMATGVAVGETTVTASLNRITSPQASLTVTAALVTGIQISAPTDTAAKGVPVTFTATGTFSDKSTGDISGSVTWSSSDMNVATVNDSGVASTVGMGNTSIKASWSGIISNSLSLDVTAPVLTAITINPADGSVAKGLTTHFTAQGTYSDASTADITTQASWASNNTGIATIAGTAGEATGIALGSTTITAAMDGVTSPTANLSVTAAVVTSIAISPTAPSAPKGTPVTFTALGTYSDTTTGDISGAATWNSTDISVATLNSSGVASTLTTGHTHITASMNGIASNTATLTVTEPCVTSISGTVYAPNGVDPLPNVNVYLPTGPVYPFTPGVTCGGGCTLSGSPTVKALTDVTGHFRLDGATAGSNVPVVIQTGRWRRQITVPVVTACVDNPVAAALSRLPRNRSEGDIPKIAVVTGRSDTLECALRKIGVADSEFTNPAGNGRIQLYLGVDSFGDVSTTGGARIDAGTPTETALIDSPATMAQYDMIFFGCKGSQVDPSAAELQNLVNYANSGGRVYTDHFGYTWLYKTTPFSTTAGWNVNQTSPVNQTAFVDMSSPAGLTLAQWLLTTGASPALGQLPVTSLRHDFDSVVLPAQQWLSLASSQPIEYSFDTPVGLPPAQQCGRIEYSDAHYSTQTTGISSGTVFPNECDASGAMTPQEKLLEYMIFHTGACLNP